LNVWEEFKVQNPNIFGLQWTSAAYFFLHKVSTSNKFLRKVAHTSLVIVVKFHINPWSYEWLRSILVKGGWAIDVFLQLLFDVFDISKQFCKHNESIEWYFLSPMDLYVRSESHYSSKFYHLSRFKNQKLPPNAFLGKFKHLFLVLEHYNLAIYVSK